MKFVVTVKTLKQINKIMTKSTKNKHTNKQTSKLTTFTNVLALTCTEMLLGSWTLWKKKERKLIFVHHPRVSILLAVFDAAETCNAITAPARRRQIRTACFACSSITDIYKKEKEIKTDKDKMKYCWKRILTQCWFPELVHLNSGRFSLFTHYVKLFATRSDIIIIVDN